MSVHTSETLKPLIAPQVRHQAVQTLAVLARSVRMEDPLYPGEGKLVTTPAVRLVQQERGNIMRLVDGTRFDKVTDFIVYYS